MIIVRIVLVVYGIGAGYSSYRRVVVLRPSSHLARVLSPFGPNNGFDAFWLVRNNFVIESFLL